MNTTSGSAKLPRSNRLTILWGRALHERTDWLAPVIILLLCITGVFFIRSSQDPTDTLSWLHTPWLKQIIFIFLGAGIYTFIANIRYKLLLEYAHFLYFGSIILLLLLWTPLGVERYDSRRWLNFGFLLYQPTEAAKIGSLIIVASLLARSEIGSFRDSLKTLVKIAIAVAVPILLIFKQPDLGSSLVFPPMVFSLLFVSNLSKRFFTVTFGLFVILTGIVALDLYGYYKYYSTNNLSFYRDRGAYEGHGLLPLKDYQRSRIMTFAAPQIIDPQGIYDTYNLNQSNISVGSGGLFGKGYGQGTQAKLGYLPQTVAHNDFIFSVIAEEKGFIGSLFVIGLFALLIGNGVRVAQAAGDRFGCYLAIGVTVIFLVHVTVNIGMTIGLMPITGLPLPFLSYGGSFLLSCCILQGLIQSVYRHRRDFT